MPRLTLRKSDWIENWYTIERLEHDNRVWLEQTGPRVASIQDSARISNADVEGEAHEMLQIADAITSRGRVSFRRCAVRVEGDRVFFCSPRNSIVDGECSLEEADELAEIIKTTFGVLAPEKRAET